MCHHISLERLVPSFQYTTASSWQYTTSVSTMRSSSRGAERKRKRKRGDLKWRQGISIGQHSSDTYVLWRSISGFSGCLSGKRSLKNLEQDKKFKERDIPGRLQQPDASFHSERNHQGNMMRQDKKRRRKRKRKTQQSRI